MEAKRATLYYFVSYSAAGSRKRQEGGGMKGPVVENQTIISDLDPNTQYDVSVFTATDRAGRYSHSPSETISAPPPPTSSPPGTALSLP